MHVKIYYNSIIPLWAIWEFFYFEHKFHVHMWLLMNWVIWGIECGEWRDMHEWKNLRFRFYYELKVDTWLEIHVKMYYKWYIPFVCERFEKFLIFNINFIFICDSSSVHIYGALGVRKKGTCIGEKSSGFGSTWS